jgi:hypothetical protein
MPWRPFTVEKKKLAELAARLKSIAARNWPPRTCAFLTADRKSSCAI